MRTLSLIGLFMCAAVGAAGAEPLTAAYTPIQNCPALTTLTLPDRTVSRAQGFGLMRCKGVGGFDLAIVDEDPRSWLAVIGPSGTYSLFNPMVQGFKLGHFPDISTTKVVEWRVTASGAPAAFIVRVQYQDPDVPATKASAQRSVLMVFDLRAMPPRLKGMTTGNSTARDLADGP